MSVSMVRVTSAAIVNAKKVQSLYPARSVECLQFFPGNVSLLVAPPQCGLHDQYRWGHNLQCECEISKSLFGASENTHGASTSVVRIPRGTFYIILGRWDNWWELMRIPRISREKGKEQERFTGCKKYIRQTRIPRLMKPASKLCLCMHFPAPLAET